MTQILDTVLLCALPASGKSEVRRYLELMPPEARRKDFHMGDSVQLDDYPYVHMMRRIDQELTSLGQASRFFRTPEHPFIDPRDWGTLIELLNEDFDDLTRCRRLTPQSAAKYLFDRIDQAATLCGAAPRLRDLGADLEAQLHQRLEEEARKLLDDKLAGYPATLSGKTLVIEIARGGPHGSSLPLPAPFGYGYSLARFSPAILEKAVVLYVWVTPEESRRKNEARANPHDPGSILHHGVPIEVMLNDYGTDDMEWLLEQSERPGCLTVRSGGRTFALPVARFDNRIDKTSFLREDQDRWLPQQVSAIHEGLRSALDLLAKAYQPVGRG